MQTALPRRLALAGFARALAAPLAAQKPKQDHNAITREEITGHPDLKNAFEVVRALRPQFLRASRASNSMGAGLPAGMPTGSTTDDPSGGSIRTQGILVIIDDVRSGGVENLRTVPTDRILEIRHMSASEAYGVYGTDQAGVIIVKTGDPAKP
jgi:hypothetical protein